MIVKEYLLVITDMDYTTTVIKNNLSKMCNIVQGMKPIKTLVLLQGLLSVLMLISTPTYNIHFDISTIVSLLTNNHKLSPDGYNIVIRFMEERSLQLMDPLFRNTYLTLGFALVAFFSLKVQYDKYKETNLYSTGNTLLALFIWFSFCLYAFVPLKHCISYNHEKWITLLKHPINSITLFCLFILGLPFSLSSTSPIRSISQADIDSLSRSIARHMNSDENIIILKITDFSDLLNLEYAWNNIPILFIFSISCVILHFELYDITDKTEKKQKNATSIDCKLLENTNEVIQIGQVRKISTKFEKKTRKESLNQKSRKRKESEPSLECKTGETTIRSLVQEDVIKPVQNTFITTEQPKTLAKVRPVNVTKPLNITQPLKPNDNYSPQGTVEQNNEINVIKPSNITQTIKPNNNSVPQGIIEVTNNCKHENNDGNNVKQKKDIQNNTKDVTCQMNVDQTDSGVQFYLETKNASHQVSVHTKETSQQYEPIGVHDIEQQTENPIKVDKEVFCDILSQERFTKLQQSALALYKKTVEKYDPKSSHLKLSSTPRKVRISAAVTKSNKCVQVNLDIEHREEIDNYTATRIMHHNGDAVQHNGDVVVSHNIDAVSNTVSNGSSKGVSGVATQTDLYGYVLEKILLERETSNIYNKQNIEKTIHSVVTLTEKMKQHTEAIRFKAMKSQHGVWYVSLRGDIFLTISQDVLINLKLNKQRKVETEVASDILRTMKIYVDNYNKLSDCFDDEEESDDESFINGFRL